MEVFEILALTFLGLGILFLIMSGVYYNKDNMKYKISSFLGVILAVTSIGFFIKTWLDMKDKNKASSENSFANMKGNNEQTTLYYSTTCPHCVRIMPMWRDIEKVYGNKVKSVNVTNQPGVFAAQGLTGVPTIKKGSKVYSGPRTFADIGKFITE